MTSLTFFLFSIPILALILLIITIILSPHSPYQKKNSVFEYGFHSFLGQKRIQFSILITIIFVFTTALYMLSYNCSYIPIYITALLLIPYSIQSYLPKRNIITKLLSENSLSIIFINIFFITIIYIPFSVNNPVLLYISRISIFFFVLYIFPEKINWKTKILTFIFIMFTLYYDIYLVNCFIYFWFFALLFLGIEDEIILISIIKPLYVNTPDSINEEINTNNEPVNVIFRRELPVCADNLDVDKFNTNIYNKTPYLDATQEDIDIANQACLFVNKMAKKSIVEIAEKEIKPVLIKHKVGANIDLTYVQLAVLKSIVSDSEELIKLNVNPNWSRKYGGTIHTGKFTLEGKDSLSFSGSTGTSSTIRKVFNQRLNDIKNNTFEPKKV